MTASRSIQLTSIFCAYAVAGVYWGAWVASLPELQAISGFDDARFGLLISSVTVGGIAGMQILGKRLHRVQAIAIPACLGVMGLSQLILAWAGGPLAIAAGLFAIGAGSGALDISLNMRVARIESDLDARLFNRVHALFPFAMLVSSASVGLLREAGATVGMIFPPIVVLFLGSAVLERRAGSHQRPAEAATRGEGPPWTPTLLMLAGLAALGATMEGGGHTWSALYVETALAAGPAAGGFAAAAITLGLTAGRLLAHRIEARLGDMAVIRLFALAALPGFLILGVAPVPLVAILGFFLAGVGIGPVEPAVFRSVAGRHAETVRGVALARATGLAYLGYLLSPSIVGQAIERAGWPFAWALLGMLAIGIAALTARVPPRKV